MVETGNEILNYKLDYILRNYLGEGSVFLVFSYIEHWGLTDSICE